MLNYNHAYFRHKKTKEKVRGIKKERTVLCILGDLRKISELAAHWRQPFFQETDIDLLLS